jgi:hypothetical protein
VFGSTNFGMRFETDRCGSIDKRMFFRHCGERSESEFESRDDNVRFVLSHMLALLSFTLRIEEENVIGVVDCQSRDFAFGKKNCKKYCFVI